MGRNLSNSPRFVDPQLTQNPKSNDLAKISLLLP